MELSLINPTQIKVISDKTEIVLSENNVRINDFTIDMPGEYEKSGVLVHTDFLDEKPVTLIRTENKNIAYLPFGVKEVTEEVVDFLWNIDILMLPGSKEQVKTFENLEAKVLLPSGENRTELLVALWQNVEAVSKYKTKEADFDGERTLFLLLE